MNLVGDEGRRKAGSKSVMVAVLSTCALLIVALIVLFALALTDWSGERDGNAEALSSPPVAASERKPAAIERPQDWITSDDYPAAALRQEIEGRVTVRMDMDVSGRLMRCVIVASSGARLLDDATCGALRRRARFAPRYDDNGRAVAFSVSRSVVWRLPAE